MSSFDAPSSATIHHSKLKPQNLTLLTLAVIVLSFGVLVEFRSAFLRRRMTDLDVYLRAAWAVRAGEDIYDITDDNHWHYHYPPLFAIVLTPLADPPQGAARDGMLPFGLSAALWYGINIVCLGLALHLLATVLEACTTLGAKAADNRRWWQLRLWPFLICLVPTGQTLMRGQVSLVLLLLFSLMIWALHRGRPVRAGLWLAGAVCVKLIPVILLAAPLWRRNVRCLAGAALGLALGLAVVPAAVFGWPRTVEYYRAYDHKVLRPGLGDDRDHARAEELMNITTTDSQSLLAMIHNIRYLDRSTRPRVPSAASRQLHWLGGGCLLLVTLLAAGTRPSHGTALVIFLGALIFTMLFLSPVCHLHYYCLLIPLVIGLLAVAWERPKRGRWLMPLLVANFMTGLLPVIPGLEVLRDIGLASFGALGLWTAGCVVLWSQRRKPLTVLPDGSAP